MRITASDVIVLPAADLAVLEVREVNLVLAQETFRVERQVSTASACARTHLREVCLIRACTTSRGRVTFANSRAAESGHPGSSALWSEERTADTVVLAMNTIGQSLAIACGVIVLLVGTVLVCAAARALRVQRSLRRNGAHSFIGGLRYHATGSIASGLRFNATWPFARLDVCEGEVVVSLSGDLRILTRAIGFLRDVPRRTTLRSDEVSGVESRFGRPGSPGLRFRTIDSTDNRDGLVFWMMPRDRDEVVRRVAAAGFPMSKD